jgi:uncharacterized protein YgiM (DUF1202 family)
MKKLCAAIAAGLALFAGVVAPGNAAASPSPEAASPSTTMIGGRCADYGTVRVNTSAVYVRTGAGMEYRIAATVYRGDYLSCWPIIVGNQYRLCSDGALANGWIPVDVLPTLAGDGVRDGYVPSTCVTD